MVGSRLVRRYLRKSIVFLMWSTGFIRLFRFLHRHQIVILMIHGVMDDRDNSSWQPLRPFLPLRNLEEYLRVLSRRYHFVSLSDAVEMLQGRRPIRPYSLVLTFDDGYRNNLTHALPVLRRYQAPATFFVPTGFVEHPRPFWFDRLDYAVQHAQVNQRELQVGSCSMRLDCSSRKSLQESYIRFIRTAQTQTMPDLEFLQEVERLTVQLEAESGRSLRDIHSDDKCTATMTWEQIRETEGAAFGSHTVDHVRLGLVDAETARRQLAASKRDIELHTGGPCECISYPKGSLNDETVVIARECGYTCGLTTEEGSNKPGDDLMRLRRIGVSVNWSTTELLACVSDVSTVLSRLVRRSRSKEGRGLRSLIARVLRTGTSVPLRSRS